MSIILVDDNDKQIGVGEKMDVHQKGLLHRAFSVLVFNEKGELLIQRRAFDKYHCGGLWANTCCSHPFPNEETLDAAHRRLTEEMGFDCKLEEKFVFQYRAEFENNLIENEIDHVFFGIWNGTPQLNLEEVSEYQWISVENLSKEIEKTPQSFAPWFLILYKKIESQLTIPSFLTQCARI